MHFDKKIQKVPLWRDVTKVFLEPRRLAVKNNTCENTIILKSHQTIILTWEHLVFILAWAITLNQSQYRPDYQAVLGLLRCTGACQNRNHMFSNLQDFFKSTKNISSENISTQCICSSVYRRPIHVGWRTVRQASQRKWFHFNFLPGNKTLLLPTKKVSLPVRGNRERN